MEVIDVSKAIAEVDPTEFVGTDEQRVERVRWQLTNLEGMLRQSLRTCSLSRLAEINPLVAAEVRSALKQFATVLAETLREE